jgi:hypothetical protein
MIRIGVFTSAVAAIGTGCWLTGAVSWTTARSALGWFSMDLTLATVPPEVRWIEPMRAWKLLGVSPAMQCAAVTIQSGRTSEPPQKCPPPTPCRDAMNEYVWSASTPPMISGRTGPGSTSATAMPAGTARDNSAATINRPLLVLRIR